MVLELLKRMYYAESTHTAYELFLLEHLIGIWRNLLAILPKAASVSRTAANSCRGARMRTMLLHFIRKIMRSPSRFPRSLQPPTLAKSGMLPLLFRAFQNDADRICQPVPPAASCTTDKHQNSILISVIQPASQHQLLCKKFKEQYKATPRSYRTQSLL